MTISTTSNKTIAQGNGLASSFTFNFIVPTASDLSVYYTDTDGNITTLTTSQYSVTGIDNPAGGSVTYPLSGSPIAAGTSLTIERIVPYQQLTDLVNQSGYYPDVVEGALDNLTMQTQQLAELESRTIQFPVVDSNVLPQLPAAAARANRLLSFDSNGNPIAIAPSSQSATALAALLASSSGASLIGFLQSGTGAVPTDVAEELAKDVTLEQFGAKGDGTTNDAAALIAAVNYAVQFGYSVHLLGKTYLVTPSLAETDAAGGNLATCLMQSNLHIYGDTGATLKISNGVSSNGSPVRFSMFFSNTPLNNISFMGVTFDMNGANNPINSGLFTQAAIIFSGGGSGASAASGTDVMIRECNFLNTAGVSCIVLMQSNTANVTLGKRWSIVSCKFYNNGLNTSDHSSIYAWSDYVDVIGCKFDNPAMYGYPSGPGGNVACELHGAHQRFIGNTVHNYYQGNWVFSNLTSPVENVVIAGNTYTVCGVGVDFGTEPSQTMKNIVVSGNTIQITDDPTLITLKCAVQIVASYTVNGVLICNNIATKDGASIGSAFANFGVQSVASQSHENLNVLGNVATGFSLGCSLETNATNGMGSVAIKGNKFLNLTGAGAFATPIGISGANINATTGISSLCISENDVIDDRGSPQCEYGIYLAGLVTNLYIGPNNYVGVQTANYFENSLTATNRSGYFDNILYAPVWSFGGTPVTIGNGSVFGEWSMKGRQVTVTAVLDIGTTTVIPAGLLKVSMPFTSYNASAIYMGAARIFNNSGFDVGIAEVQGTTNYSVMQYSVGNATNASPENLASGMVCSVQVTYNI